MTVYSTDKINWSQTLRRAHKQAANGHFEEAVRLYKEALGEEADSVLVHNNLADAYMRAGRMDEALACADEAKNRANGEVVPYVTLGEIYQAKGEYSQAVDCIIQAQEIFERSVPELKNMTFDSIEEVIRKLPVRVKFDLASSDWIRIIYLVKTMRSNWQAERDYVKKGVSWEFLLDIRGKSLSSIGQKYLCAKEKLGIKGDGAVAIANTYGAMCAIIGSPQAEVVQKSKEYSVIRMHACWQFSVIKSMELDKDRGWVKCSCMCEKQINAVARAINPDVSFQFSSTCADGQRCCEGSFETRVGANQ